MLPNLDILFRVRKQTNVATMEIENGTGEAMGLGTGEAMGLGTEKGNGTGGGDGTMG